MTSINTGGRGAGEPFGFNIENINKNMDIQGLKVLKAKIDDKIQQVQKNTLEFDRLNYVSDLIGKRISVLENTPIPKNFDKMIDKGIKVPPEVSASPAKEVLESPLIMKLQTTEKAFKRVSDAAREYIASGDVDKKVSGEIVLQLNELRDQFRNLRSLEGFPTDFKFSKEGINKFFDERDRLIDQFKEAISDKEVGSQKVAEGINGLVFRFRMIDVDVRNYLSSFHTDDKESGSLLEKLNDLKSQLGKLKAEGASDQQLKEIEGVIKDIDKHISSVNTKNNSGKL